MLFGASMGGSLVARYLDHTDDAPVDGVVAFLRVPPAGHVRTWNVARDAYTRELTRFLADVTEEP